MKKIVFAFLCFTVTFLSSCWDARELNDIGIVVMTGFDLDDDGQDRVTVFSVQPFGKATEQGETATNWLGTASGKSAFEAMRNLRRISTRQLTWVHNKIILIGENKAKKGITNINDVLSRNREFRYDNAIFITNGRADEMMQTPSNLEKSLFKELLGMIENTGEWAKGFALDVKEFALNSMASYQHGFVIGNMGFYKTDKLPFSIDYQEYLSLYWKEAPQSIAYIGGGGVIDQDRLVGWLSPLELRGYMILSNQIEEGFTLYDNLPVGGHEVSIEVIDLDTEISFNNVTAYQTNALIKVKVLALLLEVNGEIPEYDENFITKMKKDLSREIISELALICRRAQNELRTDFIGFHNIFSVEHPKEWKKVEGNWCEYFCGINIDYDVEVKIQSQGLLSRTIYSESQ